MEQHEMPIDWEKLAQLLEQESATGILSENDGLTASEQQALADLRTPWEKSSELGSKMEARYPAPDVAKGIARIAERVQQQEAKQPKRRLLWQLTSLAAAAVALILVYFFGNNNATTENLPAVAGIELNDGSKIDMIRGNFTKANDFGKHSRTVYLNGEGTFHVAKDAAKPFIVEASLGQVKVLGTVFTFASEDGNDKGSVSVSEGLVAISPKFLPNKWLKIGAGESAQLYPNALVVVYTDNGLLSFSDGKLSFDASLAQLSRFLADWEGTNIVVHPDLAQARVAITQPILYKSAKQILQMALMATNPSAVVMEDNTGLRLTN